MKVYGLDPKWGYRRASHGHRSQYRQVGITQAQADAIAANTAKSGITQAQVDAIEVNTAKIGLTGAKSMPLQPIAPRPG